ncbi:uncharacterized protein BXZ73DRAFT_76456 [Epithele typhae]|uniref:uncharacterized protein n=1 Tax=Epithele typhae TaxID=378194 RepID=UPI00200802C6|nr:uncharacterized protein BXZ73DRAFT_76456 [Epithele typhae]KAH9937819.1 hypothetical protein BXZ73DRAFT_76456 [Epithele typhae]
MTPQPPTNPPLHPSVATTTATTTLCLSPGGDEQRCACGLPTTGSATNSEVGSSHPPRPAPRPGVARASLSSSPYGQVGDIVQRIRTAPHRTGARDVSLVGACLRGRAAQFGIVLTPMRPEPRGGGTRAARVVRPTFPRDKRGQVPEHPDRAGPPPQSSPTTLTSCVGRTSNLPVISVSSATQTYQYAKAIRMRRLSNGAVDRFPLSNPAAKVGYGPAPGGTHTPDECRSDAKLIGKFWLRDSRGAHDPMNAAP